MNVAHPAAWEFALLALAAFRVYRLIARDTITEPLREAVDEAAPKGWRRYVSMMIRCPWCLGAYVSLSIYFAWLWQPKIVLGASTVLALSALIGLLAKLDK